MLLQDLFQFGVVGFGIGQNNVKNLLASTRLGKLLDQPCLRCARPRPRTDFTEALFVDVYKYEATLVLALGTHAPDQIAAAIFEHWQPVPGKTPYCGPTQQTQRDTQHDNAVPGPEHALQSRVKCQLSSPKSDAA